MHSSHHQTFRRNSSLRKGLTAIFWIFNMLAFENSPLTKCCSSARVLRKHISLAFTLVELLVVIAILAILLSLLNSSISNVLVNGRHIVCKNNLKNTLAGTMAYLGNNDDAFPSYPASTMSGWVRLNFMGYCNFFEMIPSDSPKIAYHCPFDPSTPGYNHAVLRSNFSWFSTLDHHVNKTLVPGTFDLEINYSYYWSAKMHMNMYGSPAWYNAPIPNYHLSDVTFPNKLIPLTCAVDPSPSNQVLPGRNRGFVDGHVEFIENVFLIDPNLDWTKPSLGSAHGISGKDIK